METWKWLIALSQISEYTLKDLCSLSGLPSKAERFQDSQWNEPEQKYEFMHLIHFDTVKNDLSD